MHLGDAIAQLRITRHRRIAVHAGMILDIQILHAATDGRLHPGIAHVQRHRRSTGGRLATHSGINRTANASGRGIDVGETGHNRKLLGLRVEY
jgi:hypothetical protein